MNFTGKITLAFLSYIRVITHTFLYYVPKGTDLSGVLSREFTADHPLIHQTWLGLACLGIYLKKKEAFIATSTVAELSIPLNIFSNRLIEICPHYKSSSEGIVMSINPRLKIVGQANDPFFFLAGKSLIVSGGGAI